MPNLDNLRAVVRAQNLGDLLRRAEFNAINETLGPGEFVSALAPAELRGRPGYLVATDRRVFFVHVGVAGTVVAPVASTPEVVRYVETEDGTVTLVFRSGSGGEIELDAIPKEHAQAVARSLTKAG